MRNTYERKMAVSLIYGMSLHAQNHPHDSRETVRQIQRIVESIPSYPVVSFGIKQIGTIVDHARTANTPIGNPFLLHTYIMLREFCKQRKYARVASQALLQCSPRRSLGPLTNNPHIEPFAQAIIYNRLSHEEIY